MLNFLNKFAQPLGDGGGFGGLGAWMTSVSETLKDPGILISAE